MSTTSQIINTAINALNRPSLNNYYTTLRDYQHANKTFTANNNSFLPKLKNWFHIFFELDPAVITAVNSSLGPPITNNRITWNQNNLPILGILAKTVRLPSFKFDVKKSNQYNKWTLTTTKVNYDPIEISFWDDTVDTIRGFWYAYYQYMIQDPRYSNFQLAQSQGLDIPFQWHPSTANIESLYSTSSNWGDNYGLDTVNAVGQPLNKTNPFFRSIRIYQFMRPTVNPNINSSVDSNYIEYVLVNPVISNFDHDIVDFSSSDFMQNRMTVECETVLYNSGSLGNNEIASWDAILQRFFDTTPSPLTNINPNAGNKANQIASVLGSTFILGTQAAELAMNTGQATVSSVLASAIGTSQTLDSAISGPVSNNLIVPTVITGYGSSGLPPVTPTSIISLGATLAGI